MNNLSSIDLDEHVNAGTQHLSLSIPGRDDKQSAGLQLWLSLLSSFSLWDFSVKPLSANL